MRASSWFRARAERAARRRARAGFSLVEVLAALALTLGLVVAVLPFLTGLVARWARGEGAVEAADLWMRAGLRLAADSARALPLLVGRGEATRVFYRGEERLIVFVRPSLSAHAPAALEAVALTIEPSADGEAVVRRSTAFSAEALDRAPDGFETGTTILSGPYRFRFAHVSARGDRSAAWEARRELPRLVELVAEPAGPRPAPPAPLALPILATRPPAAPPADAAQPPAAPPPAAAAAP